MRRKKFLAGLLVPLMLFTACDDEVIIETVNSLEEQYTPLGDLPLEMRLPVGYVYKPECKCHIDKNGICIWMDRADKIATVDDMMNEYIGHRGYKDEKIGEYDVRIVETEDSGYGACTEYYIDLNGRLEGYAACMLKVTQEAEHKSVANTQNSDIKQAIATLRVK